MFGMDKDGLLGVIETPIFLKSNLPDDYEILSTNRILRRLK